MSIRLRVLVPVLLCAISLVGAAPGQAEATTESYGGCWLGSMMTGRFVPGTGSVGQSIRREATFTECDSPLLPGINAARFTVTIPWSAPGAITNAELAWSDGTVSTATGYGNGLWSIVTGPATGHGIQINVTDTWNGWYLSYADVAATSAMFIS